MCSEFDVYWLIALMGVCGVFGGWIGFIGGIQEGVERERWKDQP